MTDFDKKMRELSQNVDIPEGYDKRIEDVLQEILDDEETYYRRKHWLNKKKIAVAFGLVCIICFLGGSVMNVNANILETFKLTIMDILNIGEEELGVESKKEQIESKPDLKLEMQEVVTDNQGMYLLVKITAPPDITFSKEVGFDYFAFCEGENYNADKLIGGGRDCYLLETIEEKPNVATYVVSLTADMKELEGEYVTAYFNDLTLDPNGENKLLVEGMWSITFVSELTVKESVSIEGDSSMVFPFVNTTATVEHIELTPLGITLLSDVSKVPFEDLGISDTTIAIRLKMIDGSEINIMPSDSEKEWIVDTGSIEYSQEDGHSFQKATYSFNEAIDITKVVGFYIQDIYLSIE